jgi:hypothetical protein
MVCEPFRCAFLICMYTTGASVHQINRQPAARAHTGRDRQPPVRQAFAGARLWRRLTSVLTRPGPEAFLTGSSVRKKGGAISSPAVMLFVVTAADGVAHLVTEKAMAAGRPVGRYLAVCGTGFLAASLTIPERGCCRSCRRWRSGR